MVLCVVLQWPDVGIVECFLQGFQVICGIAPSGVYPWRVDVPRVCETDLLIDASEYVDQLEARPKFDEDARFMVEECEIDYLKGFGSRLLVGQVEALRRRMPEPAQFAHGVSGQARRMLADVARGSRQAPRAAVLRCQPAAPSIEVGSDDLPDACRHMPVQPSQYRLHVVAVPSKEHKEMRYQILYGMMFGLAGSCGGLQQVPALPRRLLPSSPLPAE